MPSLFSSRLDGRGSRLSLRRALGFVTALWLAATPLLGGSRLKDIAVFAGTAENQLVGYGLVFGINGDGDKNPTYTLQAMANLLQRHGITLPATTMSSKNVAAVIVTAELPASKKPGTRIDVTVAAMGDAKTLQGGILVQTPLIGVDGKAYALAQGPLIIGGFSAGAGGAGGATAAKNHPTTGQILNGGQVVREIPSELTHDNQVELLLREPDFTSAARIAERVNEIFTNSAVALDSTTVRIRVPEGAGPLAVDFIARLEAIEVEPDVPARIVINERTGTIVATSQIRISSCAVSHGNITITIAKSLTASQPGPLATAGQTVVTPSTDTNVKEEKRSLVPLPDMPTVERVASALNSLGVTPRDAMSIFTAMKQAGALHADLILR